MSGRMLSGVISTFRCSKRGLILCCYNLRQVHREQEQLELADFKDISSSKIYSSSCEWNDQHGCSQVCSCLISPSCLVSKPSATFFPHHFSRQPLHSCTYCFLCFLSLSFRWQSGKKKKICLPKQQMQKTRVRSLGWEDSLEEGMATHSSILFLENSVDRGTWQLQSTGLQRVGHDRATNTSLHSHRLIRIHSPTGRDIGCEHVFIFSDSGPDGSITSFFS